MNMAYEMEPGNRKQPVPRWIKVCGVTLLGCIILALYMFTQNGNIETNPLSTDSSSLPEKLPKKSKLISENVTIPLQLETNAVLLEKPAPTPSPAWIQSQDNLNSIERLDKQLAQVQSDNVYTQQQVESYTQQFQDLRSELEALKQTLQQIKIQQDQKQATLKKKKKRITPTPKINFTLVGIDSWGDQLNAVIRMKGKITTLRQGARLQNWTVESIDLNSNSVTFRNLRGNLVTLKVSG